MFVSVLFLSYCYCVNHTGFIDIHTFASLMYKCATLMQNLWFETEIDLITIPRPQLISYKVPCAISSGFECADFTGVIIAFSLVINDVHLLS